MKKFQTAKIALSLSLACMLFVAPLSASAQTNKNASVDSSHSGKESIDTTITLPSLTAEITIGQGGKYLLLPKLSEKAKEYGFSIDGDYLKLSTSVTKDGTTLYTKYKLTWSAAKPAYASVKADGTVSANKVCKLKDNDAYYCAPVVCSVPDVIYKNLSNEKFKFADGIIYKNNVTVVAPEDLLVYYLGVWSEDLTDTDAQHFNDYNNDSSTVKNNLRLMAQDVTEHCHSSNFKITALTKINNGLVRAYLKTMDPKAGSHYYVLKFNNADGSNKISVVARDYCEKEYTLQGSYTRN
ncbi:MAG: hypothetical protein RR906_04500 [Acetivibrio sp.]